MSFIFNQFAFPLKRLSAQSRANLHPAIDLFALGRWKVESHLKRKRRRYYRGLALLLHLLCLIPTIPDPPRVRKSGSSAPSSRPRALQAVFPYFRTKFALRKPPTCVEDSLQSSLCSGRLEPASVMLRRIGLAYLNVEPDITFFAQLGYNFSAWQLMAFKLEGSHPLFFPLPLT